MRDIACKHVWSYYREKVFIVYFALLKCLQLHYKNWVNIPSLSVLQLKKTWYRIIHDFCLVLDKSRKLDMFTVAFPKYYSSTFEFSLTLLSKYFVLQVVKNALVNDLSTSINLNIVQKVIWHRIYSTPIKVFKKALWPSNCSFTLQLLTALLPWVASK